MSTHNDEDFFMQGIATRLAEDRKRLKLTQEDVAKICETSARTIASWESGKKIPAHQLARMIAIGIDAWYVLSGVRLPCDSWSIIAREAELDRKTEPNKIYEIQKHTESHQEQKPSVKTCDSGAITAHESHPRIGTEFLDWDRLRLAFVAVEEGLIETKRTMEPARKAELVAAIYDFLAGSGGTVEKARVLRLVKAAV